MKKRLLASLLTLCMVLTLLPTMTPAAKAAGTGVWVNGVNLTNGGSTCGGKATYNAGEKTLTLNGATINTTHDVPSGPGFFDPYGIYTDGDLTIQLLGENFVTLNMESQICAALGGNLTFKGTGSLTVRAAGGFDVAGNFTVPKSVSLSISVPAGSALGSSNTTFDGVQYTGLYSRIVYKGGVLRFPVSKLYVNGVDMLGSGAKPSYASFNDATSTLTLNGATINTASSVERNAYGIYADSDLTVHLIGANTVAPSGTSDYGIYTLGALTFTGATSSKLTVTTSESAIAADGNITIRSGTDITATSTAPNSAAITDRSPEATSVIIIETGAKVIAEATGANSQAIYMDSITIGGFPYSGTDQKIVYNGIKLPFPPKVLSVTPNSASAPTSGNLVITFDMPMNTSVGTVKLNELTALTGGTWSNGNKTYTIPYSGLADSTRYTVKIENFQGATGNVLALDNAHNFTTTKKVIVSDKISLATPDLTYNGREQDCGDATITGITASGNAHWAYTYTAVTGTLGVNSKPLGAGTYTVKVTYNDDANSGEKSFDFTVKQADVNIVLDTAPTNTSSYTYGNAMTFTAKFSPASAADVFRTHLYIDDIMQNVVPTAVNDGTTAVMTFVCPTAGESPSIGQHTVTVKQDTVWQGNYKSATSNAVALTLTARPLTATATKAYDGTKGFTSANLTLVGIESYQSGGATVTDDVTGTIPNFDTTSADVGSYNASPTVTLAGARKAWYTAPASVAVTITAKTVSTPNITTDPATYVHTGSAIIPTNVVVMDGDKIIPESEYTLSYSDNINAGQATITVTDKENGNYTVSGTGHFTISNKTAVTVNMDGITLTDRPYDGTAISYTGAAAGTYGSSTPYAGAFTYEWYKDGNKLTEAPKAAGSYTLKATVSDSNYAGVGSKDVTIAPKPLTIGDGNLVITKTYDGTATFAAGNATGSLALTAVVGGDTVTAKIDTFGAAADANVGTKAIDLGVSLDGADKGNYTITSPYSFKKASITVKAITPTVEAIAKQAYTGGQLTPAVTVKDVSTTLAAGDYDVTYGANVAVGAASGSAAVTLKGNYSGTANATFEIGKATTAGVAKTFHFVQGTAKSYTFDLSAMLPSVTLPASLGAVSYAVTGAAGTVLSGNATIAGSTITLPVKEVTAGVTQNISITITSENYTIAPVTLTLTAVDKEPLTIAASMAGGTYNGTPLAYGGTPTFKKTSDGTPVTSVSFGVEYEGVSPTSYTKTTVAPTNAGTYKLILTVNGASANTYAGSVEVPFTIAKATITVTAASKSVYVGDTAPVLTADDFSVTGLVGNQTLKTKPTLAYATVPDMTKRGTVTITASAAAAPDGGNYNDILYVSGTLTISNRSSGGGTVTPPVPKPEPPKTDPGTGNTEVSVPVKPVTKGDTSSATVPEKSVSDAIAAAEKEAAKTGGSSSVTITVDAPKGAKTVETTLPSKSLSAVADGKTEGLKISTPVADLSFDSEALKNIAGMAGKDVKISATQVDTTALTDAQKSQVGDAPVFDFTVTSGDKTISNFNGGTATVSVPYTPKEGENPEFVTVWLLDDAGKLIPIEAKYKDGKISFETGHFSRYAIGYLPFTDVKADWAYESIVYAYQNQLFSGVGENKFAPTANMNRAMLWTVLYRMAGSPGKTETPANWYADAQAWVMAEKISDGTNPDGNITREQLAAILWRYAQSKKQDVSIGEDTNILSYDDFDQMSQYAIPALQWACGAGIINGKSNSVLDPAGNATRAQVAAMLQRYAVLPK